VELSARGTSDPDGDELDYRWWQYGKADSDAGQVAIGAAEQPEVSFAVPDDAAPGETIHVVAEVTDRGTPPLTRYQRVVLTATP